jgi:hypothetical protein
MAYYCALLLRTGIQEGFQNLDRCDDGNDDDDDDDDVDVAEECCFHVDLVWFWCCH